MNHLNNLNQFQKILKNYQISQTNIDLLNQTSLILLLGFSGSGRSTIIKQLSQSNRYYFLVSDTTRQPRLNNGILEKNGREYNFISEDQFLKGLKRGDYLEAEIIHQQQVSGLSLNELKKAKKINKFMITDIDLGGAQKILQYNHQIKLFFIIPPSFDVWMSRLYKRDSDMPISELLMRLKTAQKIINTFIKDLNGVIIINNDFKLSAQQIDNYLTTGFLETSDQNKIELLKSLNLDIKKFLAMFGTLDS
jgi:guanylate kinase